MNSNVKKNQRKLGKLNFAELFRRKRIKLLWYLMRNKMKKLYCIFYYYLKTLKKLVEG